MTQEKFAWLHMIDEPVCMLYRLDMQQFGGISELLQAPKDIKELELALQEQGYTIMKRAPNEHEREWAARLRNEPVVYLNAAERTPRVPPDELPDDQPIPKQPMRPDEEWDMQGMTAYGAICRLISHAEQGEYPNRHQLSELLQAIKDMLTDERVDAEPDPDRVVDVRKLNPNANQRGENVDLEPGWRVSWRLPLSYDVSMMLATIRERLQNGGRHLSSCSLQTQLSDILRAKVVVETDELNAISLIHVTAEC